jgi:endogenous inhibitor of DNA gyrase (YacG/DUF329 family)
MIKVNCPSCGVRLSASNDHIGRPVTCQKCETKFVLSKRWTNEPLTEAELEQKRRAALNQVPSPVSSSASSHDLPVPSVGSTAANSTIPAAVSIPVPDSESATFDAPSVAPVRNPATDKPLPDPQDQLQAISLAKQAERRGAPSLDGYAEARSFVEFFDFRFRRYVTPWILKIGWLLLLIAAVVWFAIATYTYVAALLFSAQAPESELAGLPGTVVEPTSALVLTFFYVSTIGSIVVGLLVCRVVFESVMALFSICNTMRTINLRDREK